MAFAPFKLINKYKQFQKTDLFAWKYASTDLPNWVVYIVFTIEPRSPSVSDIDFLMFLLESFLFYLTNTTLESVRVSLSCPFSFIRFRPPSGVAIFFIYRSFYIHAHYNLQSMKLVYGGSNSSDEIFKDFSHFQLNERRNTLKIHKNSFTTI